MNNTPPKNFSVVFIILNIVFTLAFEHRTDSCSVSCFLCPLIVCFQVIVLLQLRYQCQLYFLAITVPCIYSNYTARVNNQ